MIPLNLSPTDQLGFSKQTTYRIPKPQGSTIECNTLNLADSDADYFVGDQLLVVIPVQFPAESPELGILTLCQQTIANINKDTNLRLYNIVSGRKRLSLSKPIEVTPDFRDGLWTMENEDFDIISMSTDYKKCLRDFHDEVFFIYEEYGREEDDKLTNGAKELKRKILRHIGE